MVQVHVVQYSFLQVSDHAQLVVVLAALAADRHHFVQYFFLRVWVHARFVVVARRSEHFGGKKSEIARLLCVDLRDRLPSKMSGRS